MQNLNVEAEIMYFFICCNKTALFCLFLGLIEIRSFMCKLERDMNVYFYSFMCT